MAKISSKIKPDSTYSIKDNTFLAVPKPDVKDLIQKEIGDSKVTTEFLPQTKIMRWDNEVNFSVRLVHNEASPVISKVGETVKWSGKKIEAKFYDVVSEDLPEGASEFEVVLKEKPLTNVVEFTLNTKGLDFFYQPEIEDSEVQSDVKLTPEELLAKKREMRPENVVGSYAVYASENKVNYVGGKEYKTGKVGHIYRPQIEDSAGNKVWGELNIENGILKVTIPQEFLDTAVYPVKHAAGLTFGYTTLGASGSNGASGKFWGSFLNTAVSADGVIDSISVGCNYGSVQQAVKAFIVNSSTLDIISNSITSEFHPTSSRSFRTITYTGIKPVVTNGNNYSPCVITQSNYIGIAYDSTGTNGSSKYGTNTYSSPTSPISVTNETARRSIYATYISLSQEGFAFGDDDGNESAHSLDTQDTDIVEALGTKTLRTIVDATGDPDSSVFKIKYQKNGSGGYSDVPTSTTSPNSAGAIDTGDVTNSGNNTASTSWAISHPAASTGDLIVFNIAWDDSTTVTGLTSPAGPNGETAVVIEDAVASGDTDVRGKVVYYIATGSWSAGTLTFTPSASEQWTASVIKVLAGEFDATTPIGSHNNNPSDNYDDSPATPAVTAGASDGGGRVVAWFSRNFQTLHQTPSGWTTVANVARGAVSGILAVRNYVASNNEVISEETGWSDIGSNWVSFIYIVRGPGGTTNNPIYISASDNVTAGGEATTARLTAPSGKTTSNFTTGRRWDDENGLDSIDIAENFYTELEWILTTNSPATTDDYFEFRVYRRDDPLATYTVTPKWTIAAGGGSSAPTVTTQSVSSIASTTATGNGNVTADGGATVTERGVCWGTSTNPTIAGNHSAAISGGTGVFTASITSLSAKTHYYVRAYATNSVGTSYGDNIEFDTSGDFILADETSSSSIENITLAQSGGTLSIADESSASSIDNITLQFQGNFQIADSESSSSIDNITIVRNGGDFTIANEESSSSIENISLIGNLQIDNAESESSIDNVTIERNGGDFVIEDETSSSSIENISIQQSGTLLTADIETTSNIENVILEQNGGTLAIGEITSTSEIENIGLIGNFIIGDVVCVSAAEEITLEFEGATFEIEDISSTSTVENIPLIGELIIQDINAPPTIENIVINSLDISTMNKNVFITQGGLSLQTGGLRIPTCITAERPTALKGSLIYNTELNSLEIYDGSNWVTV